MRALPIATALAAAGLADAQNELVLNNGPDVSWYVNDPSVGSPVGTFPPDWNGELFWKVYPRETLLAADGDLSVTGLSLVVLDSNWSTSPDFHDFFLSRGQPSSTVGGIEPTPGDPNGVFVSLGNSGLPDPCSLPGNPYGCVDGCPSLSGCTEESLLYEVEITFATPIVLDASSFPVDGTTDLTITFFIQGGMPFVSGGPTGCSSGDYTFQWAASNSDFLCQKGEDAAEIPGTNAAPFGGWNAGGGYQPIGDWYDQSNWVPLSFEEPILNARPDPGSLVPAQIGTAGVLLGVGLGQATLGVQVQAKQHATELVFCAGTLQPPLAPPGLAVLGANLLLAPDFLALALAGVWSGSVAPNGVFQSPQVAIPDSAAGFDLHLQGVIVGPLDGTAGETNVWTVHMLP